jgi:general L-amino acid transport system permease protein
VRAGVSKTSVAADGGVIVRRHGLLSRAFHDRRLRALVYQAGAIATVVALAAWLIGNAMAALEARGIASGFGYLAQEAGFGIGEGPIPFLPADSYARAFLVGLLNTLKVSACGIVAATLIGLIVGLLRLSSNWAAARLASAYVEVFRNTPLLVQIVFWYLALTHLPGPRQALTPVAGVFLSNRGLQIPWPQSHPGWVWAGGGLLIGIAAVVAIEFAAARRQDRTGVRIATLWPSLIALLAAPLLAWWFAGAPASIVWPQMQGFNFRGGLALSPEFTALFLGLSLYIAAFLAEIVRSGLQAVSHGQVDAGKSLGLSRGQIYRLVLVPQALRIIIPPTAAQYVSLAKNSALAVAIGYPDLVNITNTTINQTGHTIEAIVLMSAVYLAISFSIAGVMNLYNRAVALKER